MRFRIHGPAHLKGEVRVGGAKNAALKILPACLLASSPCTIHNVPDISDIRTLLDIMRSMGVVAEFENGTVYVDASRVSSPHPEAHLVKRLRGSIVLIGPLLACFGEASLSQPGGCLIGARPIDDHIDVFEQMGVSVDRRENAYVFYGKPKAGHVVLGKMSVTATENALMAAVFSKGVTTIHAAAAEPEIGDLVDMLNAMGARVEGAGTHEIRVQGVERLSGVVHSVVPDRIEAGTYLIAGILTNSSITVGPIIPHQNDLFLKKLRDAGANFEISQEGEEWFVRTARHQELIAQDIDPRPYPGFPTDLQPQYAVLMTQARGRAEIFDTLFNGRFRYVEELRLMKADMEIINPNRVAIKGPSILKGAEISSLDIRGGAAVVLAGLVAEGETVIHNIEFVDRGYEHIDERLKALGADIKRET